MKIRITKTPNVKSKIVNKVIDLLIPIKGPLIFKTESIQLDFNQNNFDWNSFYSKCSEYRITNNLDNEDFLVVLTDLRNNQNWFSSFSLNGERTIFVQTSEWENYIYSENEYPVTYEIIANILRCLAHNKIGGDIFKHVHHDPIGCTNDLCQWKQDITYKLRTADICDTCMSKYSSVIKEEIIEQSIRIFESIRKKMLFNKAWHKKLTFDENLPFPIAITKRKLGTTLDPLRKMVMLINHFDSIIRTTVIIIAGITLDKNKQIEFFNKHNLNNTPSLGMWRQALSEISRINIKEFPEFDLPADFSNKLLKVLRLENDEKIVKTRNEYSHGYMESHDSSYKELFTQYIPIIENIEMLLSPIFYRYKYLYIIKINRIEGTKFKVNAYVLSGSNPTFAEEEIDTDFHSINDLPYEKQVYLVSLDSKKWINMHPYFKYSICDKCKHNRFLIYEGKLMMDPYVGHRV